MPCCSTTSACCWTTWIAKWKRWPPTSSRCAAIRPWPTAITTSPCFTRSSSARRTRSGTCRSIGGSSRPSRSERLAFRLAPFRFRRLRIHRLEGRVAEPGTDRENAPALRVAQARKLAEALHDRVVVHDHAHMLAGDFAEPVAHDARRMEMPAMPLAGQVLRTALDVAVERDHTGTADADQRRELAPILARAAREPAQHRDELVGKRGAA